MSLQDTHGRAGERTGLVVRASDSGSGDRGSILGRVGVLFPSARDIYSPKVLVIPRNRWLCLNMTEKLFTGTLNNNQNKTKIMVGRPSVVIHNAQRSSPKLLGRSKPNFMWSLLGKGEQKFVRGIWVT